MKCITALLTILLFTACSRPIPPEIRAALDQEMAGRSLDPGWKFVKVTHGFSGRELVIDILVSEPLQGDPAVQRESLKSRICPTNREFWEKLKGYKLSVAAYTQDRKFTLLADCDNPNLQSAESGH
jgi:hypothetical protein